MLFENEPDQFVWRPKQVDPRGPHSIQPAWDLDRFKAQFTGDAFQKKVAQVHLKPKYSLYLRIRGDGNCLYRASMLRYIQLLLGKQQPNLLRNFTSNIRSDFGLFSSKNYQYFKAIYQPTFLTYMEQVTDKLENAGVSQAMTLFHQMVVASVEFDEALITLLRILVANFITAHPEDTIEGLAMTSIIQTEKYPTLQNYISDNVLTLGTEAEDLVVYLIPVVLRIGVVNIMIDKNASDGFKRTDYKASTDQTIISYKDGLNFHNLKGNPNADYFTHFFRPGHYEILVENDAVPPYFRATYGFFENIGYNSKGDLVAHLAPEPRSKSLPAQLGILPRFSRLSGEDTDQDIKMSHGKIMSLHCSDKVDKGQMLEYFRNQFGVTLKKSVKVTQLFAKSSSGKVKVPRCPKCLQPFSFNDIHMLFPGKFRRNQFMKVQKEYQSEQRLELERQALNSQEAVKIGYQPIGQEVEPLLRVARRPRRSRLVCIFWLALAASVLIIIGILIFVT